MAKDDYFKIIYIILFELYESLKQGEKREHNQTTQNRQIYT